MGSKKILSFEQKEREHLSNCISVRVKSRHTQRGKTAISISDSMLKLLEALGSGPIQFHEVAKTDTNKVYTTNRLMKYGLIKRKHSNDVMFEGKPTKVRPISMFYITMKGKKLLEVLDMPNEV